MDNPYTNANLMKIVKQLEFAAYKNEHGGDLIMNAAFIELKRRAEQEMKFYNGFDCEDGIHTIKVSLQHESFKGSFTYEMGGICKGASVLDFNIETEDEENIAKFKMHDCSIKRDEYGGLAVTLTNDTGKTFESLELELDNDNFMNLIIGIEIVEFKEEA